MLIKKENYINVTVETDSKDPKAEIHEITHKDDLGIMCGKKGEYFPNTGNLQILVKEGAEVVVKMNGNEHILTA